MPYISCKECKTGLLFLVEGGKIECSNSKCNFGKTNSTKCMGESK